MITLAEENYLKAVYHLMDEDHHVMVNEISKFLKIKMPSVNNMMKKFAERNWVIYESYKPIKITQEGIKEASRIVRKHRLTEMYLAEKMGFGWEEVHEIAEQIEHIQSEKFFDKIDELLDCPKVDPRGSPIPDKNGNIIHYNYHKLSECKVGQIVLFHTLVESSKEFLNYLNDKKLSLNTEITIVKKELFDQSMTIAYNGRTETLSHIVTDRLLVEVL